MIFNIIFRSHVEMTFSMLDSCIHNKEHWHDVHHIVPWDLAIKLQETANHTPQHWKCYPVSRILFSGVPSQCVEHPRHLP